MKNYKVSIIIKVSAIILMVVIDMLTKLYFQNYFSNGGQDFNIISGILGVTYVINTGGAWGILADSTILLVIFSIVFLLIFAFIDLYYKSNNGWYIAGFSLIIGGAIGNLIDRIVLKGVRDFIQLQFIVFPIFNFADMFLTVGVICYIVYLLFYEMPNMKKDITKE